MEKQRKCWSWGLEGLLLWMVWAWALYLSYATRAARGTFVFLLPPPNEDIVAIVAVGLFL